jgi:thioesterase domain-containing protein
MDEDELQDYLYQHIPLSAAMQVEVVKIADTGVALSAPLGPNINHRETLFGGSASAVAILAAWCLLQTRLQAAGIGSRLVIQRNTMHYDLPILGTFVARSFLDPAADWDRFLRTLLKHGKARISVGAVLEFEGRTCGRLLGEFVAIGADGFGS